MATSEYFPSKISRFLQNSCQLQCSKDNVAVQV